MRILFSLLALLCSLSAYAQSLSSDVYLDRPYRDERQFREEERLRREHIREEERLRREHIREDKREHRREEWREHHHHRHYKD